MASIIGIFPYLNLKSSYPVSFSTERLFSRSLLEYFSPVFLNFCFKKKLFLLISLTINFFTFGKNFTQITFILSCFSILYILSHQYTMQILSMRIL